VHNSPAAIPKKSANFTVPRGTQARVTVADATKTQKTANYGCFLVSRALLAALAESVDGAIW
jgi:hypothetical protein